MNSTGALNLTAAILKNAKDDYIRGCRKLKRYGDFEALKEEYYEAQKNVKEFKYKIKDLENSIPRARKLLKEMKIEFENAVQNAKNKKGEVSNEVRAARIAKKNAEDNFNNINIQIKKLKNNKEYNSAKDTISTYMRVYGTFNEVETFLKSGWFLNLTTFAGIDPEYMINEFQKIKDQILYKENKKHKK